jgi:hypothetical protein
MRKKLPPNLSAAAAEIYAAAKMLTTCKHIDLGDLVYRVRENEGKGWDGPAVTQWSKGVTRLCKAIELAESNPS